MDTFPIVKRKDEEKCGEYRTKRVILEIYDAMQEAIRTGQTAPNPREPGPRFSDRNGLPDWKPGQSKPSDWPSYIHPPRGCQPTPTDQWRLSNLVDGATLPRSFRLVLDEHEAGNGVDCQWNCKVISDQRWPSRPGHLGLGPSPGPKARQHSGSGRLGQADLSGTHRCQHETKSHGGDAPWSGATRAGADSPIGVAVVPTARRPGTSGLLRKIHGTHHSQGRCGFHSQWWRTNHCNGTCAWLPESSLVYHSYPWLHLARSDYSQKQFLQPGEADFIVVDPEHGLLVLEVKGGTIEYEPTSHLFFRVQERGGRAHPNPFGQGPPATYTPYAT